MCECGSGGRKGARHRDVNIYRDEYRAAFLQKSFDWQLYHSSLFCRTFLRLTFQVKSPLTSRHILKTRKRHIFYHIIYNSNNVFTNFESRAYFLNFFISWRIEESRAKFKIPAIKICIVIIRDILKKKYLINLKSVV